MNRISVFLNKVLAFFPTNGNRANIAATVAFAFLQLCSYYRTCYSHRPRDLLGISSKCSFGIINTLWFISHTTGFNNSIHTFWEEY